MKKWAGFFHLNQNNQKESEKKQVRKLSTEEIAEIHKSNTDLFFLEKIPQDIFNLIFENLDRSDLQTLSLVCRRFNLDKTIIEKIHDTYQFISKESLPLYRAILKINKESKEKLFAILDTNPKLACDIQSLNNEMHNFFTWAVKEEKQSLLNEIYQHQCELIGDKKTATRNNLTKLHWAILCNQPLSVIKELYSPLISLDGSHSEAVFSPLMCAILMNRKDVLTFLFEKNPRIKTSVDLFIDGCAFNALMIAVIFNRKEMVDELLEKHPNLTWHLQDKAQIQTYSFLNAYQLDFEKIKDLTVIGLSEALHRDEEITEKLKQSQNRLGM